MVNPFRILPISIGSWVFATTLMASYLAIMGGALGGLTTFGQGWTWLYSVGPFPMIVVWTAALFSLLKHRRELPQVTGSALAGMSLLFLGWLPSISPYFATLLGEPNNFIENYYIAFLLLGYVLKGIGWWLVFLAILGWRDITEEEDSQAPSDSPFDRSEDLS